MAVYAITKSELFMTNSPGFIIELNVALKSVAIEMK
jgi:hypothetical protein